jgi:crotonobetainyl-CoA:carnitine CoA-transferase CaiB-like acyl-CoA transferase
MDRPARRPRPAGVRGRQPGARAGGDGRLRHAPAVGEHSEEILLELGKTWEEIAALKADQAVT